MGLVGGEGVLKWLLLLSIFVYLDWMFRVRPSKSTWPAAYCSITSFTSYGFKASLNFRLATKYFICLTAYMFSWRYYAIHKRNKIAVQPINQSGLSRQKCFKGTTKISIIIIQYIRYIEFSLPNKWKFNLILFYETRLTFICIRVLSSSSSLIHSYWVHFSLCVAFLLRRNILSICSNFFIDWNLIAFKPVCIFLNIYFVWGKEPQNCFCVAEMKIVDHCKQITFLMNRIAALCWVVSWTHRGSSSSSVFWIESRNWSK